MTLAPPTRRISTTLATLLACAVLLPLLGHKPLAEWDEAIYAEVSREMLHGSWLIPHWNGQLWLEKPPLMLWITAAFFKLFGVTEFWARASSTFSGIAIVGLLHQHLARTRDLLAAWLGTIILLATLGFLHINHVGEMDVLLSLGACLALIGLSQIQSENRKGWYLFFAGFAIALMTKGAASVTIPITAAIVALTQRWNRKHFGPAFYLGLAAFAALVLPWHIAMYHRAHDAFIGQYLGLHILTRATQQIEGHTTHWWYYGVVLIASAPPFFLLYPFAIYRGLGRPTVQPWAIFSFVTLIFFTLIQTRLPHYIAPAYPALAVLTAACTADWLSDFRIFSLAKFAYAFRFRAPIIAAIWTLSIALTHSTLKGLHSASLAGPNLLDNREVDALLKSAPLPDIPGPLLYLRNGRVQSIATVVFYARRPVQQVALTPPGPPFDRYRNDPQLLIDAVETQPQLILVDSALIPQLQRNHLVFQPIRSLGATTVGTISSRLSAE